MDDSFRLSELVQHTADELRLARKQTDDPSAIMQFQSCEIELAVTVRKEGSAGLRFHVVEAGGKLSSENTSKIKLVFGPIPGRLIAFRSSVNDGDPGPAVPRREERDDG